MGNLLPKSIRGKVTLTTALVTAVAMLAIVGITAYATQWILKNTIANSLSERLDRAQMAVAEGDYELALDMSGTDLMQIIDAHGNVLATTTTNKNIAPLTGIDKDDDEFELDDLEFEVDDDDDDKKARAGRTSTSGSGAAASAGSGTAASGSGASGSTSGGSASTNSASGGSTSGGSASQGGTSNGGSGSNSGGSTSNAGASAGTGQGSNAAQQPAYDDDDDYDDPDDPDDDDAREVAVAHMPPAYDDSDDDDDYDDDGVDASPAQASPSYDDHDDDSDDDYDDDEEESKHADAAAAYDDDDDDDSDDDDEPARVKSAAPRSSFVQTAWAADSSSSSNASSAAASSTSTTASPSATHTYVDASDILGDAGPYLVMRRAVDSPDGPLTLAAVTSLAPAVRAGQVAAQMLIAVMLLVLLLVVIFTWRMTARTLQPVEEMRATAESINARDLSARIPVPDGDEDLSRLATTFNDMLARVEASFNDQKRFISDASHELKSPVAATSVMLETLQTHPESVDTQQVLGDLESQNQRMGSIVGDLLQLARSDEGRLTANKRPIDLMDLLFEEANALRSRTSVQIDTTDVNPVVCEADPDHISHIVRNLMENAARYAKSKVKVSCAQLDNEVLILVSDDGPGISEADRERVFDRFVRLDPDRSQGKGGTGLGLSVVRSMVEANGGTVRFAEPELGGATAVVSLPVA